MAKLGGALTERLEGILQSRLARPAMSAYFAGHVTILFYHGVWRPDSQPLRLYGGVDTRSFETDLRQLTSRFDFVPLSDALRINASHQAPSRPVASLTFDDGLEIRSAEVSALLARFGISATVFVMPRCCDNTHLMWFQKFSVIRAYFEERSVVEAYNRVAQRWKARTIVSTAELPYSAMDWPLDHKDRMADELYSQFDLPSVQDLLGETPYMTWPELREWVSDGHDVGLHTQTHPFCHALSREDLHREIVVPAERLRSELGLGKLPFAYPFGVRIADRAGEAAVMEAAGLSCMLGVGGLSRIGTPPVALERVQAEAGLGRSLFLRPLAKRARKALRLATADLAIRYAQSSKPQEQQSA